METIIIDSNKVPKAVGPYSHSVRTGNLLFLSGQVGIDPEEGKLVDGGVEVETRQIFKNIKAVLEVSCLALKDVVKTTVFLDDMDDFALVNKIYEEEFDGHKPARSAVEAAKLPIGAKVEIECIAEVSY